MNKYIKINGKSRWFNLFFDKQTAVFGASGNILGSAIHRMNKSRYKVYVIWKHGAMDMLFKGIGEAMDWLQKQYDYEVQKLENP